MQAGNLSQKRHARSAAKRAVAKALGYGIAVGCFYWIFRDVDFGDLLHSLGNIVAWWLIPVVLLDLAAYLLVAIQWQLLLRPVGRLGLANASRAVFAGRFANDVLPVQLGYLLRVYLASRYLGRRFSDVVPSLLIERLLDGLWLAFGVVIITLLVPLPAYVVAARNILGAAIGVGVLFVLLVLRKQRRQRFAPQTRRKLLRKIWVRLIGVLNRVMDGVRGIVHSRVLSLVVLLAALKLLVQGLAYYGVIRAYGLPIGLWKGLAVFLIAYLGITVPSTPASVGVFQFFSVVGLELFGIQKDVASAVSLVAFVVLTLPLAAAGFWAFANSGLKWRGLARQLETLQEEMQTENTSAKANGENRH